MSSTGCGARWNKCPPPNQYANDVSSLNETPNQSPTASPGNKRKKPDDVNEENNSTETKNDDDDSQKKVESDEKDDQNADAITDSQPFQLEEMDSGDVKQEEQLPESTNVNDVKITYDISSRSEGDSCDDDFDEKTTKRKNVVFERFLSQRRGHTLTKWLKRKPCEDQSYDCYAKSFGDNYVIKPKSSAFVSVGLFGYGNKCGEFVYDKPVDVQGYGSKIVDGEFKEENGKRHYGLRGDTTLSIYNDSDENFTITNNTKIATVDFKDIYFPPYIKIDSMHDHQCTFEADSKQVRAAWSI